MDTKPGVPMPGDDYSYTYRHMGKPRHTETSAREQAALQAIASKQAQVVYRLVPIAIIRPPIDVCEVVELEKK